MILLVRVKRVKKEEKTKLKPLCKIIQIQQLKWDE